MGWARPRLLRCASLALGPTRSVRVEKLRYGATAPSNAYCYAAPAPHSPSVSTHARGTDRKGAWGSQAARTAYAQNCRRGNPLFGFAPYGKRVALSTVRAALATPRLRACCGSPLVWAIPRLRVLRSGSHVPAAACPRMRSAAVHAVYMGTRMSKYAWGSSAPPCRSPLRPLRGGGAQAGGASCTSRWAAPWACHSVACTRRSA